MKDIRVTKSSLISTMKKNRDEHQAEYDKAVVAYRKRAIELIEELLDNAKKGDIKLYISLPVPEIHTDDYDRAVQMLEWELDPEVVLSETDFSTYVLNQWGWAKSFASNTSSYNR